jgi:putative transposase
LERVFEELMHHLRESVRKAFGKAISPIDSKTVRTSHHIDTLGIIPVVVIHTANILRPDAAKQFTVPSKRWIVDRTFSWFESFRRLSKDNEVLPETSQTMIYLTMIQMMLNRTK